MLHVIIIQVGIKTMGFGNGSDSAQELMNQSQIQMSDIDIEEDREEDDRFSGTTETDLDSALEQKNPFTQIIGPELEALDLIYSALRKPAYGASRLEGLRSYPETPGSVTEQTWNRTWRPEYTDAGLTTEDNLTDRGKRFAEDEMPWWIEKSTGLEGLDEFYDIITCGSKNQKRGSKIKAFRMYGSGENSHTEVYSDTGLNPSTARTLADNMEDINLLTQDDSYRFTEAGEGLNNLIDGHIAYLQDRAHRSQELPHLSEKIDSEVDQLMLEAYRKATE